MCTGGKKQQNRAAKNVGPRDHGRRNFFPMSQKVFKAIIPFLAEKLSFLQKEKLSEISEKLF